LESAINLQSKENILNIFDLELTEEDNHKKKNKEFIYFESTAC